MLGGWWLDGWVVDGWKVEGWMVDGWMVGLLGGWLGWLFSWVGYLVGWVKSIVLVGLVCGWELNGLVGWFMVEWLLDGPNVGRSRGNYLIHS